jgi:hypothetical protein
MRQALRFDKTDGLEILVWRRISVDEPEPGQVQAAC